MGAPERSKVERMSLRDVRAWLARYERSGDEPCEHGHYGCSTEERGPCLDEALHALEAEDRRRETRANDKEERP